jgi:hypothetical protein
MWRKTARDQKRNFGTNMGSKEKPSFCIACAIVVRGGADLAMELIGWLPVRHGDLEEQIEDLQEWLAIREAEERRRWAA